MPQIPALNPDGEKIAALIKKRGYRSVRAFALTRKRPRTLLNVVYTNQRASVEYMRRLARVLGTTVDQITLTEAGGDGEQEPERAQRPAA